MLDQNTDRMWYVIGAVLVGAAIILIANGTIPEIFATVTDSFEDVTEVSIDAIDSLSDGQDLLHKGGLVEGAWVNNISGELDDSVIGADHVSSDYIPVKEYQIYQFTAPNGLHNASVAMYTDKSDTSFDSGVKFPGDNLVNNLVKMPEGVKYVRISARDSNLALKGTSRNHTEAERKVRSNATSPVETWSFSTFSGSFVEEKGNGVNLVSNPHFDISGNIANLRMYHGEQYVSNSIWNGEVTVGDSQWAKRLQLNHTFTKPGVYTYTVHARINSDKNNVLYGTRHADAFTEFNGRFHLKDYSGQWKDGTGNLANRMTIDQDEWKSYTTSFYVPEAGTQYIRLYLPAADIGTTVEVDWHKLEQGTIATPL